MLAQISGIWTKANEMSSKPTCTLLGHLPDLRTAIRLGRVLVDL